MLQLGTEGQSGFTMVELLISMAIGLVIITTLTSTFVTQRQAYDVQQQITTAVQTARAAMDMMSREIRLAGYDPTDSDGFYGITYDPDQLRIQADVAENDDGTVGDGDTDDANEDIIYKFSGSAVTRNTGSGDQPFAENAQDFSFEYLDANGAATVVSSEIRRVKITLAIQTEKPDSDYGGYRIVKLTSNITPRNLKF